MPQTDQARKWCFTLQVNDHDPQTPQGLWESFPPALKTRLTFLVMQYEVAPSTGKLHAQGAASFSGPMRMAAVKKLLPGAHLEVARAWEKATEYCVKQETRAPGTEPFHWGEDKGQGARSDLKAAVEMIREGKTLREVAEEHGEVFARAHKGLQQLQAVLHPPVAGERKVGLFWGPTETGKTRSVFDHLPDVYTVFDTHTPWFDGYQGEPNVLLDECGPGMMNHNLLKRLLDRYPMTVPIKGGSVAWQAKTIILTSNVELSAWYPGLTLADYKALERRMRIFEFPRDKALAVAWLKGELVAPAKRERPPSIVSVSSRGSTVDSLEPLRRQDEMFQLFCDD